MFSRRNPIDTEWSTWTILSTNGSHTEQCASTSSKVRTRTCIPCTHGHLPWCVSRPLPINSSEICVEVHVRRGISYAGCYLSGCKRDSPSMDEYNVSTIYVEGDEEECGSDNFLVLAFALIGVTCIIVVIFVLCKKC